ncbi:IS5 family transposase [bacterium]|nr:IS5 family transposase [bacterium]
MAFLIEAAREWTIASLFQHWSFLESGDVGGLTYHHLFGRYKSIHARFTNWSRRGVFLAFFNAVRDAKDLSLLRFVDASFVKCSIAYLTGRGAGPHEVTGKTKGGFTTKVTAICDTKQRVYACRIDPGNDSDHKIAEEIELPGRYRRYVGDKGFSSSKFCRRIEASGHTHCIAQKSNEKAVEPFHKGYYRLRHNIENVFARMGRWTRLELRRERKASHFESFLNLWAISTWVKI